MPLSDPVARAAYARQYRQNRRDAAAAAGLGNGPRTNLKWSDAELDLASQCFRDGLSAAATAKLCNERFHTGRSIRTHLSISWALTLRRKDAKVKRSKSCVVCGVMFLTSWPHAQYCSTTCRDVRNREAAVVDYNSDLPANRSAQLERVRAKIERRWAIILQQFGNRCGSCGITYPRAVYDLHHPNGKTSRNETPARIINGGSEASFARMLSTTVLLCANCHRLEHANLKNWAPGRDGTP